jgi:hypothetical protein
MSNSDNLSKRKKIAGWVLTGLLALIFIPSAISKLIAAANPTGDAYQKFVHYGLDGRVTMIGLGELVTIITFIFPKTSSIAVLFLSAHLGGAIVTHMEHGENFVFQSVLLAIVWITQWLRDPNMFNTFRAPKL